MSERCPTCGTRLPKQAPFSDDDTSKAAAESLDPTQLSGLRREVYDFILRNGGATDDEIQLALGLEGHSQTPRRWELMKHGFVVDSGLRRKTSAGRSAVVWVAKE